MQNKLINDIFSLKKDAESDFNDLALRVFRFQYENNIVYRNYCEALNKNPNEVNTIGEIPFLPISFFKTHKISAAKNEEMIFTSSGTGNEVASKHYVNSLSVYKESFTKAFELFYGNVNEYCILALLPGYLERKGSSLIYMVTDLIKKSKYKQSGFFLYDFAALKTVLEQNEADKIKTLLIGVSFALLNFAQKNTLNLENTIVMETGGMKGKRKEITREELHKILKRQLGVTEIHSEYGMAELLSQAYAVKNGKFECPPWLRILIRQVNDPFNYEENEKTGGINIIDLANIYSCSFIETKDLGKKYENGLFEVLGRFDYSDIRGCNLMV